MRENGGEEKKEEGRRIGLTWTRKLIHGIGRPNQTSSFNEFGFLNGSVRFCERHSCCSSRVSFPSVAPHTHCFY